jgi:hypothetical protein
MLILYGEMLLAPAHIQTGGSPFNCLLNMFAAVLHIWNLDFPICNARTRHAMVRRDPLDAVTDYPAKVLFVLSLSKYKISRDYLLPNYYLFVIYDYIQVMLCVNSVIETASLSNPMVNVQSCLLGYTAV